MTHHSINHANNPFPQYIHQLITQPIRYGYTEADDAHTKTLVPLSSHLKLTGERVTVKRWMVSSLLGLILMTHVQLNYCSNDAMTVMNHFCFYFFSCVSNYTLEMDSRWLCRTLAKLANVKIQLILLYEEYKFIQGCHFGKKIRCWGKCRGKMMNTNTQESVTMQTISAKIWENGLILNCWGNKVGTILDFN